MYVCSQYNFTDRVVTATGWGTTTFGGRRSDILQKVNLNVISNTDCKKVYGNDSIRPDQLCTQGKGKDACQVHSKN